MIFDEIVIENFGVFRGPQRLKLAPDSGEKPIILIGGLNGGGKTTLLDALQLALYGRFARCSNRGTLGYDDFITRCIHRGIRVGDTMAIELRFRRLVQGEEQQYAIRRSWDFGGSAPVEHITVSVNGAPDAAVTDSWTEHVEAIIPQGISSLFFFDGEKIEELAAPKSATAVLSTALNSLLGLEIVDRLTTDLNALARRKAVETRSELEREQIRSAELEIKTLDTLIEDADTARAQAQNRFDYAQVTLKQAEEKHRKEGGTLFLRQDAFEKDLAAGTSLREEKRQEFYHQAAGAAPLALVSGQLNDILAQALREHEHEEAVTLEQTLAERDRLILSKLKKQSAAIPALAAIARILEEDRKKRKPREGFDRYLDMDRNAVAQVEQLVESVIPALKKRGKQLRSELEDVASTLTDLERKQAALPEKELITAVANFVKQAQESARAAQTELELADAKAVQLRREREQRSAALIRLVEKDVHAQVEMSDDERIVTHSARVRQTLVGFREAIIRRHVKRIEHYVFECFRQLLHKRSLVTEIQIDPESYSLVLFGANKLPLAPERLSAGERQLLAVALLWGLARAAGRALPTFIDTPLGRLDAEHRRHLVERYFPFAAHQVVLLSTDKEIEGDYYKSLTPFITREYTLVHDDQERFTRVVEGYFNS